MCKIENMQKDKETIYFCSALFHIGIMNMCLEEYSIIRDKRLNPYNTRARFTNFVKTNIRRRIKLQVYERSSKYIFFRNRMLLDNLSLLK